MGKRRQARELALQALYVMDTAGTSESKALDSVNCKGEADEKTFLFVCELVRGTAGHREALDRHIEETAKNWTLIRMAAVDRNVLRLAAYEILHSPQTPVNVVIDEAIEIARKFSTEESTKFINGILDKLKALRPHDPQKDPDGD
ncbi:MAG: transcription antitermination factor NusB [Elusimicrobia bacterium]|nr:transcription antitermination factor NusB [Elusimicrobiota bacterium]